MPTDPAEPEVHRTTRRAPGPRRRVTVHLGRAPERVPPPSATERFRNLDRYRVGREWKRYEGTPQRELFRELRSRFLERHRPFSGWSVDVGSGPGRFAPFLGGSLTRRVLLDLSTEMLKEARERSPVPPPGVALVRGDGVVPPLRRGGFSQVVALGNPLGFAAERSEPFLDSLLGLVAPGGTLVLEIVCGGGERSSYLSRLPPGAARRLLAAPVNLVRSRVEREGFRRETRAARGASEFRRHAPAEIMERLERAGFRTSEVLSVAPCLGAEPERIAATWSDPMAWLHLLELEEQVGRSTARRPLAAALLIAATRGDGGPEMLPPRETPARSNPSD